jgi:hypothetical protein
MQNLEDAGNLSYGATGTTAPTLVPGVGDAQRGGAGAVAALQDARDPETLCAMCAGWAAWVCAGNQSESIRCAEAGSFDHGAGRRRIRSVLLLSRHGSCARCTQ